MEQFQAVVENRTGFCLDPRTKLLLMAVVYRRISIQPHRLYDRGGDDSLRPVVD